MRQRLAGLRLRFRDPILEAAFREDRFQLNLGNVRFAFLAGIALWIGWGLLLRPYVLVLHELHPSKEAVDAAIGFGEGLRETFEQLDDLLVTLGAPR